MCWNRSRTVLKNLVHFEKKDLSDFLTLLCCDVIIKREQADDGWWLVKGAGRLALFTDRAQLQRTWLLFTVNFPACLLRRFEAVFYLFMCKCSTFHPPNDCINVGAAYSVCRCSQIKISPHRWTNKSHWDWTLCCYGWSRCLDPLPWHKDTHKPTHSIIPFGTFRHLYHLVQLWWRASLLPTCRLDNLQGWALWFCCRSLRAPIKVLTPVSGIR